MKGHSLAGSGEQPRVADDFYATDPESVRALLDAHNIEGNIFLEPCCGQGHISEVLKEGFPEAFHYATDLVDRGYGNAFLDFLDDKCVPHTSDWIITNPPFKHAREFVTKSLLHTDKGVAMFLKIQFLESVDRKEWLQSTPLKYIYVFSKRQATFRDGNPINPETNKPWSTTMCVAWFVWEHGYTGEPMVRWL